MEGLLDLNPGHLTDGIPVFKYFIYGATAVFVIGLWVSLASERIVPVLSAFAIGFAMLGSAAVGQPAPQATVVFFVFVVVALLCAAYLDDTPTPSVSTSEPPAPTPAPVPMSPLPSAPPAMVRRAF